MRYYNVQEAVDLLQQYKITTHPESVRRWLRNGTIKAIPPASRKEGWVIREDDLYDFIRSRLPEDTPLLSSQSDTNQQLDQEAIRAEMWWELARKFIFEGYIEPKKKDVQACIEHKGHSKAFGDHAWNVISQQKLGHANPRIPYLLDAFLFNGKRIRIDENFGELKEQILYAVIESIRIEKVKG